MGNYCTSRNPETEAAAFQFMNEFPKEVKLKNHLFKVHQNVLNTWET